MKIMRLAVITLIILVTPLTFGLVPAPPSVFFSISPDETNVDIAAGDTIEFQIDVFPQGEWVDGIVSFELENIPEGVIATFVPDTWVFPDRTPIILVLEIPIDSSQGIMVLNVITKGTECCFQGGVTFERGIVFEVNVNGVIEEPDESVDTKQTVTVTTSTIITLSTFTKTDVVTSYVTHTITTKTSSVSTLTSIEQPIQVADFTYPVITLGIVSALLFGVIIMRKNGIIIK